MLILCLGNCTVPVGSSEKNFKDTEERSSTLQPAKGLSTRTMLGRMGRKVDI
jgi:hypothetical protein